MENIAIPFLGKIKIDFDQEKKAFFLTCPIFCTSGVLPSSVRKYVEARESTSFKPYKTSFKIRSSDQVDLIQELPFRWGFQPNFREHIHAFRKIAAHCHHTLLEISIEEKLAQVEELFVDAMF